MFATLLLTVLSVPTAASVEFKVISNALTGDDFRKLSSHVSDGNSYYCCGWFCDEAAASLQHRLAEQLNLTVRHLSDVHVESASTGIATGHHDGEWGAAAVLFLENAHHSEAYLQDAAGTTTQRVTARENVLVIVPDGMSLMYSEPLHMAWIRIRRDGADPRGPFDFYAASWVRKNFVAPHDNQLQRSYFEAHTRDPRYWHGFFWSFVGVFCTLFSCLPVAFWGYQIIESMIGPSHDKCDDLENGGVEPSRPGTRNKYPTLLTTGGRTLSMPAMAKAKDALSKSSSLPDWSRNK
jgi:hypothetical protein